MKWNFYFRFLANGLNLVCITFLDTQNMRNIAKVDFGVHLLITQLVNKPMNWSLEIFIFHGEVMGPTIIKHTLGLNHKMIKIQHRLTNWDVKWALSFFFPLSFATSLYEKLQMGPNGASLNIIVQLNDQWSTKVFLLLLSQMHPYSLGTKKECHIALSQHKNLVLSCLI